ncbi:hypothetical protein C0Z18_19300 [Trinickia dabaoshanensis]|uniref:Uncharacterized protein n=1 Tax=Trinickia dabaoshanensis TaxID=564714 RepID=A0A2N7VKB3_9BURK|nr:hypothetical protein C0Z18_19300 [Trinickia dabaoshanensis]
MRRAAYGRFGRVEGGARIPYLSAGSMLQASRTEDHAYSQIADIIETRCVDPKRDLEELWRRLAPAFDVNPFPDKDPKLKLWLTGDSGPVHSIRNMLGVASYFRLSEDQANRVLGEVCAAIRNWRAIAQSAPIGLTADDLEAFAPALANDQIRVAAQLLP